MWTCATKNRESVMQYFGHVATLAHFIGLRRTVNCVLMDVRCSALSRSVTVFPLKTRFINASAAILKYFVNTTLKFSAIIEWKIQLKRSSVKVLYLRDWISNLIKSICLRHYNSKAIVQRLRYPKRTMWTDLGRRQKWEIENVYFTIRRDVCVRTTVA